MIVAFLASPQALLPKWTVSPVNSQPAAEVVSEGVLAEDIEWLTLDPKWLELLDPIFASFRA